MKGKNLLLHHYRRAFAIAAIALASVGATQAQNLITPGTQLVLGTAFKTTTDVDWDNQTLEADIDLSTLSASNAASLLNIGETNAQDAWYTQGNQVIRFYWKADADYKHLNIWVLQGNSSYKPYSQTYELSSHGNTIHISLGKSGMTVTDGNGSTFCTINASDLSNILSLKEIEVSVNKNENVVSAHATYNYVRLKGLTTSTNSFGMKAIKGWTATASDVDSLLTEKEGNYTTTAYDLSALDVEDGVTVKSPSNANAIIMTTGTVAEDGTATATKWTNMPNLVVASDGNLYAAKAINLTDNKYYYPVYTDHAITTTEQSGGFTYTREIFKSQHNYRWFSMCLPMDMTIPDGITVWRYNPDRTGGNNNITFTQVYSGVAEAHTPYFAYTNSDITLKASGTGVLDLSASAPKTVSGDASKPTLHGNYGVLGGDGTQYALQSSQTSYDGLPYLKIFKSGSTIDAFRAYITLGDTSASADDYTLTFEGEATGISNISTENTDKEASIYTIDGRCTGTTSLQALPHGLYIQGGKKVVVK